MIDINYLSEIASGQIKDPSLSKEKAIQKLGNLEQDIPATMLVEFLDNPLLAKKSYEALLENVYLFEAYYDLLTKHEQSNPWATRLLKSLEERTWLKQKPPLPKSLRAIVFKVPDCVTADMLSPQKVAWSRSHIPIHAQSVLKEVMPTAAQEIQAFKASGYKVAFVVDKLDTRKASVLHRQAAIKALCFLIGERNPLFPLAHRGIILGSYIDSCSYAIGENIGSLLLTLDTESLYTGGWIEINPYDKKIVANQTHIPFQVKHSDWQSIWSAGGRIAYTLGNTLTYKAKEYLQSKHTTSLGSGYTLAQKIIGKACGLPGVIQGTFCEPLVSLTTLSERDSHEIFSGFSLKGYGSELVITTETTDAISSSSTVVVKARDGKTHAWLSRLAIPDSIQVSSDPYDRLPMGITLPIDAYWSAVTGSGSFLIPKSILVRFYGQKLPFIKWRDVVHAIPYFGLQESVGRKLFLSHYIVEIEGLASLPVEVAYEFTESSAAYQGWACVVQLEESVVRKKLEKNKAWLQALIHSRYPKHIGLKRRLSAIEKWLAHPKLLKADSNASYAKVLNIDLGEIKEPLLAAIHQPYKIYSLSTLVARSKAVHAVWIGSTALHVEHYYIVAKLLTQYAGKLKARLWLSPPSALELRQLMEEGYYQIYGQYGVYTEMPENTMCTQSRFEKGSVLVTTSSSLLLGSQEKSIEGYIASPELATIIAILGRFPTLSEYHEMVS